VGPDLGLEGWARLATLDSGWALTAAVLLAVAGVAVSSETREDPEVVYWSYALGHWNRRPLSDRPGVPAAEKCGWLDPVDRADYRGPRFVLVRAEAFVPPPPPPGPASPPGAP
jgi:hypothetical protein